MEPGWGPVDEATGQPVEVPGVYATKLDDELCESAITAGQPLGAGLKPNQLAKLQARQKKSGGTNFCQAGNVPVGLYIGEGTDYLTVLAGAKKSLVEGKLRMVVLDLPAGFPPAPAKPKRGPAPKPLPKGTLQEVAEFFAPFPYSLYLLGNPVEPDPLNHLYYPLVVRIDKLFYSPLYGARAPHSVLRPSRGRCGRARGLCSPPLRGARNVHPSAGPRLPRRRGGGACRLALRRGATALWLSLAVGAAQ